MIAAIDFDHTLWNPATARILPGAKEAINLLRELGAKIVIHSCNNKDWIERCLNNNDIRFDWIWDQEGKPVADIYIDDCGYHFKGDWATTLTEVAQRLWPGRLDPAV